MQNFCGAKMLLKYINRVFYIKKNSALTLERREISEMGTYFFSYKGDIYVKF